MEWKVNKLCGNDKQREKLNSLIEKFCQTGQQLWDKNFAANLI